MNLPPNLSCSFLFIPTSISSFISSHYSKLVTEKIVRTLFLVVMIAILIKLFLSLKKASQVSDKKTIALLISAGCFSDLLDGLTGVGTGIILGPLLLTLGLTDERKISPTINFLIITSCFFYSLNYLSFKNFAFPQSGMVRLDYALYIAIPAILSSIIGRKLNKSASPKSRKIVVGCCLALLILKSLFIN